MERERGTTAEAVSTPGWGSTANGAKLETRVNDKKTLPKRKLKNKQFPQTKGGK